MSSKRKHTAAKNKKQATAPKKRTLMQQLRRLRGIGITLLVIVAIGGVAWFYQAQHADMRDVSVIGNGTPTVVQLYDQNCVTCRQLDKNAKAAMRGYNDDLQFRIVNLNVPSGQAFAQRYNGGQTTLLYFDGNGRHVTTVTGVQSSADLQESFDLLVAR
ncbi:MAG: hypothetical protein JXQ97_05170 [Natronospirillum sp.]